MRSIPILLAPSRSKPRRLPPVVLVLGTVLACSGGPRHLDSPPPPTTVDGPQVRASDLDEVVISASGSCGVSSTGLVRCWGVWDGAPIRMPSPAATLTGVAEVRVGYDAFGEQQRYWNHICVRLADGAVRCWGNSEQAQLGDGSLQKDSAVPVAAVGLPRTVGLALGARHSCALSDGGTVACWGGNAWGQVGSAGGGVVVRPASVDGLAKVSSIAATDEGTCALTSEKRVYCWGAAQHALVRRDGAAWSPREVSEARGATVLATGRGAACAVIEGGLVRCWRGVRDLLAPDQASSGVGTLEEVADAEGLALGDSHGCVLRASGEVWCFGKGELGQLGDGVRSSGRQPPRLVTLPGRAVRIVGGSTNVCARLEDHRWFCWGGNVKGQIRKSGTGPVLTPVELDLSMVDLVSD